MVLHQFRQSFGEREKICPIIKRKFLRKNEICRVASGLNALLWDFHLSPLRPGVAGNKGIFFRGVEPFDKRSHHAWWDPKPIPSPVQRLVQGGDEKQILLNSSDPYIRHPLK